MKEISHALLLLREFENVFIRKYDECFIEVFYKRKVLIEYSGCQKIKITCSFLGQRHRKD